MQRLFIIMAMLVSLVGLVSCQTTRSVEESASIEEPLSLKEAQSLSYHFREGMPENEIITILGIPDKTESKTCGTNTDQPWTCRVYMYTWESAYKTDTLMLIMQRAEDAWYLNSWSWL